VQLLTRRTGYKQIVDLMLQVAADANIQSDDDSVTVILELIDELIDSLYDVQESEMFADDDKQKYVDLDLYRPSSIV
jgi:hypothetical protein